MSTSINIICKHHLLYTYLSLHFIWKVQYKFCLICWVWARKCLWIYLTKVLLKIGLNQTASSLLEQLQVCIRVCVFRNSNSYIYIYIFYVHFTQMVNFTRPKTRVFAPGRWSFIYSAGVGRRSLVVSPNNRLSVWRRRHRRREQQPESIAVKRCLLPGRSQVGSVGAQGHTLTSTHTCTHTHKQELYIFYTPDSSPCLSFLIEKQWFKAPVRINSSRTQAP